MALPLSARIEAVLFAAGESVRKGKLAEILSIPEAALTDGLAALSDSLAGRGLALVQTAGEVELRTASDAATDIKKLRESELSRELGKASLETLAIILYQNGATRGQIDWVRGVNSAAALRSLLLRGLIEKKEDPSDKRRMRYDASIDALAHLGIARREELPRYEEFAGALAREDVRQEAAAAAGEENA